ncbi:heparinase II/III domain-containing protein [Corynebacterium epidermidicanis]|uniref:Serine acetyltransferase n=1 Tax=Corynebacterium epidermidicanis TaxID=1050174 RepID=A0A0G3GT48_9CORY|nr:heparinase II/III family protein [Corynebacterium epidermidicanis]AKK02037.1 serine acetyltransferase [Corynebacterium epidermidicanis]
MTTLKSLSRSVFEPQGGTSVTVEDGKTILSLPTGEKLEFTDIPCWQDFENQIGKTGQLYLHGGQFIPRLASLISRKDAAQVLDSYFSWISSPEKGKQNRLNPSWDHATAMRIESILYLSSIHPEYISEVVSQTLVHDIEWSCLPESIKLNNHGLFLIRALLFGIAHATSDESVLGQIKNHELVRKCESTISTMLPAIIQQVYGEDGWCGENSPLYDRVWINLLSSIREKFTDQLVHLSLLEQIDRTIELADKTSRFQLLPSSHYVPRGDSSRLPTGLSPIFGTHFNERVGIWVYSNPEFYLLATAGHSSITHKHVDDTQIYLSYKGVDFFIDGGTHSYNYSDGRVKALRSNFAHSVLDFESPESQFPWDVYRSSNRIINARIVKATETYLKMEKKVRDIVLTRTIKVDDKNVFAVTDEWDTPSGEAIKSRFLLPNNCTPYATDREIVLHRLGKSLRLTFSENITVSVYSGETKSPFRGWYSTKPGELIAGNCLEVSPAKPSKSGKLTYRVECIDEEILLPADFSQCYSQTQIVSLAREQSWPTMATWKKIDIYGISESNLTIALALSTAGFDVTMFSDDIGSQSTSVAEIQVANIAQRRPSAIPLISSQPETYNKPFVVPVYLNNESEGSNCVWQAALSGMTAVQLYYASNKAHQLGLFRGANYLSDLVFRRFNCKIYPGCSIGNNFTLGCGGIGVVIHKNAVLGDDVTVAQNVTLGGRNKRLGPPKVGNNVYFGANSVFIGGSIGDNCVVGAGSVVLEPVPSNSIVAGNPARVIKKIKVRS